MRSFKKLLPVVFLISQTKKLKLYRILSSENVKDPKKKVAVLNQSISSSKIFPFLTIKTFISGFIRAKWAIKYL